MGRRKGMPETKAGEAGKSVLDTGGQMDAENIKAGA
jgi:hypothetical protein